MGHIIKIRNTWRIINHHEHLEHMSKRLEVNIQETLMSTLSFKESHNYTKRQHFIENMMEKALNP